MLPSFRISYSANVEEFDITGATCFNVEMGMGTGKTCVYIKTMFELNRLYGWSKFVVVVSSIAICESVSKTFETTEQHFFESNGKCARHFVYNSDRLTELDRYAEDDGICCMIINMQAFNTSMREGARNKYARKSNPLHNLVYELDTLGAYNQRLVKRIEVRGFELCHMRGTDGYLYPQDVVVSRNKPPVAAIKHKYLGASGKVIKWAHRFNVGDSVYDESGPTKLEAYRDYTIALGGIYSDVEGQTACVRFLNGEVIYKGEVYGDSAEEDMRRAQIRETIRSHL